MTYYSRRTKSIDTLTRREMDILLLLGQGYSNREIAERLTLELGTVKWYTIQIYAKLGVHNRTKAALEARRLAVFPVNTPLKHTNAHENWSESTLKSASIRDHNLSHDPQPAASVIPFTPNNGLEPLRLSVNSSTQKREKFIQTEQTLRNAIDWSYKLLPSHAQAVFAYLAVFVDGWTENAAEAVCGQLLPRTSINDTLILLQEKSLILATSSPTLQTRFYMREPIRLFAFEKLGESDQVPALQAAHAAYYLAITEQAEKALYTCHQMNWLDRLNADYWNMLEAVDFYHNQSDGIEAELRMVGTLAWYWIHYADHQAGYRRIHAALRRDSEDIATEARTRAYLGAAKMEFSVANYADALKFHQQMLTLSRAANNEWETARALLGLAIDYYALKDIQHSMSLNNEAIAIVRRLNDLPLLARLFNNQAIYLLAAGQREQALTMYHEALTVSQSLEQADGIMILLGNLGQVYCQLGDYERSTAFYHEFIIYARRLRHRRNTGFGLFGLGVIALAQAKYLDAENLINEGLNIMLELGSAEGKCEGLMLQARLASELVDYNLALSLVREAYEAMQHTETTLLKERVLDLLARLVAKSGEFSGAVRLFGALETTRNLLANRMTDAENKEYEQLLVRLRQLLGSDLFATIWAEGVAMSIEAAAEYALTINV